MTPSTAMGGRPEGRVPKAGPTGAPSSVRHSALHGVSSRSRARCTAHARGGSACLSYGAAHPRTSCRRLRGSQLSDRTRDRTPLTSRVPDEQADLSSSVAPIGDGGARVPAHELVHEPIELEIEGGGFQVDGPRVSLKARRAGRRPAGIGGGASWDAGHVRARAATSTAKEQRIPVHCESRPTNRGLF